MQCVSLLVSRWTGLGILAFLTSTQYTNGNTSTNILRKQRNGTTAYLACLQQYCCNLVSRNLDYFLVSACDATQELIVSPDSYLWLIMRKRELQGNGWRLLAVTRHSTLDLDHLQVTNLDLLQTRKPQTLPGQEACSPPGTNLLFLMLEVLLLPGALWTSKDYSTSKVGEDMITGSHNSVTLREQFSMDNVGMGGGKNGVWDKGGAGPNLHQPSWLVQKRSSLKPQDQTSALTSSPGMIPHWHPLPSQILFT